MEKFLKMMGYLILLFIVLSNHINIYLSDAIIILLGILSAIFICIGIFMNDKKFQNNKPKFNCVHCIVRERAIPHRTVCVKKPV